jgi:plastocyanin
MHPFFHKKYYVLFAIVVVLTIVVLYLEFHYLYTTFIPSGNSNQTHAPVPTSNVTKSIPSPTITHGPIPPQSQITPAYSAILSIAVGKDSFNPLTATMTTEDLITFVNTDTVKHSITIEGRSVDVLVNGMTGQRFTKPDVYTITDKNTGSTLSLTVGE